MEIRILGTLAQGRARGRSSGGMLAPPPSVGENTVPHSCNGISPVSSYRWPRISSAASL